MTPTLCRFCGGHVDRCRCAEIEVTDEMVERARLAFNDTPRRLPLEDAIRAALTAALAQPKGDA